MKRAVIHVKGRVQRVGYRDEVEEIARQLEIAGFVENIKPYDVQIIAEGEDSNIEQFIRQIKIKKFPINVELIEVQIKEFKSEFEYFKIKRGEWQEEIGESVVETKGLRQDLKSYMEERFDSLEHEIVMIKEKIGMM